MTDFTYHGEALLLSWTDSSAGRKVTFLLPDDGEQHPFKDYKTGPVHGQPFGIGCKPVDYDNPEKEKSAKKPGNGRSEAQECGRLCADPGFQQWLEETYHGVWYNMVQQNPGAYSDHTAALTIRHVLGVSSRAEIDINLATLQRWQRLRSQYETDTGRVAEKRR